MRVIEIFSAKGGVGKTTLTANLGAALSTIFNKRVCLLDANVTAACLALHYGLYYLPTDFKQVIKNNRPLASAMIAHPSGVKIIPSSLSLTDASIDPKIMRHAIRQLHGFDYVLVDSAPCLDHEAIATMKISNELLVVTTPDLPSVANAARAIRYAKDLRIRPIGVVLNRVQKQKYELPESEIEALCDAPVVSTIPEDRGIPRAIAAGVPSVLHNRHSNASVAINHLAGFLAGEAYYPPPRILRTLSKIKG